MDRLLLRALALACCIGVALAPHEHAAAAQRVVAVRHWTAPDHTRIVVDLTEAADYSTRVLTGPDRIVVFVVSARLGDSAAPVSVGDGLVERIRLNQLEKGAQVVIDLSRASAHNVFDLKPYAGKPHRVVIDVFHEGSATSTSAPARTATPPRETPAAVSGPAVRTVVIDAGHGGEDPGAVGSKLAEKDVVLDIAKKLATALDGRPGIDVRMTRLGDYGVSLGRRRQIARQGECDLFVSIHANSAPNRDAHGTEVFFLSPRGASDQKARELESRENAADLVGGV